MDEFDFSQMILAELKERDSRANELTSRVVKGFAEIGIEKNGEFKALLLLTGASKNCNVMSVLWRHEKGWAPTMVRGTPTKIAERLALPGSLQSFWTNALLSQIESK